MKATISFVILMTITNLSIGSSNDILKSFSDPIHVPIHSIKGTSPDKKISESKVAISDIKKALKIAKKANDIIAMVELYGELGAALLEDNDLEPAYKSLEKGHELDPNNSDILNMLISVCFELGRDEETLNFVHHMVSINPDSADLYNDIGFEYLKKGDQKTALKYFNIAIVKFPRNSLAYSSRAYVELQLGEITSAKEDIKKAIRKNGASSWAYKVRGLISAELGDTKRACFDFRLAVELETEDLHGLTAQELIQKYCTSDD